jgi:uncharacterized protein YceH (UPF0502 family)
MNIELSPIEARIIGCLIEKQITTPDQYPLSLNALVSACNQKSNRDPVLSADEAAIQTTLGHLIRKHLVIEKSGFGSRVPKYQHRFCNTEFEPLKFTPQELAIVCELRTRAARMASFSEVGVESALESLSSRADGPFVVRLSREPGRRDSRYAHLFSGAVTIPTPTEESIRGPSVASAPAPSRLERLEEEVRQLKEELTHIKARLPPQ